MGMIGLKFVCAEALVSALLIGFAPPAAASQRNPVDRASNPHNAAFTNVRMTTWRDFRNVMVREGAPVTPERFRPIVAGLSQAEVLTQLGEPLSREGKAAMEWNYNFRLALAPSQTTLICQYKVVFDDAQIVSKQVLRRRQCEQLAEGSASPQ